MTGIDSLVNDPNPERWRPVVSTPSTSANAAASAGSESEVSQAGDGLTGQPASDRSRPEGDPAIPVDELTESLTERPRRWDVPFGETMDEAAVNMLLQVTPFKDMDESRFTRAVPLNKILLNDTRLVYYKAGDVIVREGDYGNSAFLVLSGKVRVTLESLPKSLLGQEPQSRKGLFESLSQLWKNSPHRESRVKARVDGDQIGVRDVEGSSRIFLQDVPGVLDKFRTLDLNVGEFFGELAALSRTARSATVFAVDEALLLEVRWQGLRDIMRRDPALQNHIHTLYRKNSLETHLRETPYFQSLTSDGIQRIAEQTEFETFGNFEWHRRFKKTRDEEVASQISDEPIIGVEGNYIDGMLLIRNGFARLSRRWGDGHRTLSYLGKGQAYGLAELVYATVKNHEVPRQHSLRALGYVDALKIPSHLVRELIVPQMSPELVRQLVQQVESELRQSEPVTISTKSDTATSKSSPPVDSQLEQGFMEFIAENRLMNGTQTMIIDLDRCIRCDDCVQACASTHNNNPRFVREGVRYGSFQFPNACMHCVDPVCLIGCPTGAIAREPHQGNVLINDETCVGCRTCAESCPYSKIQMVEITDAEGRPFFDQQSKLPILKATKCDLCESQLGGPACQRACSHDALIRIDMSDTAALKDWTSR